MTVTLIGSLSLGAAMPGALGVAVAAQAGINLALPDIEARLEALLSFAPQPVDFSVQLALAQSIVASIQASIAVGITPPSIDAQLAIVAALIAELEAAIVSVHAQLSIVLLFAGLLGIGGVHLYRYSGQAQNLGTEFTTALATGFPDGSGPTAATEALLLGTTTAPVWAAIQQIFKTVP